MSLNMRIIPNPGDGIVQAISDCVGKSVGFTKNCFDLFNICLTTFIGLIFAHKLIGIGLGTVIAVLGVGRVIAVFNHHFSFYFIAHCARHTAPICTSSITGTPTANLALRVLW